MTRQIGEWKSIKLTLLPVGRSLVRSPPCSLSSLIALSSPLSAWLSLLDSLLTPLTRFLLPLCLLHLLIHSLSLELVWCKIAYWIIDWLCWKSSFCSVYESVISLSPILSNFWRPISNFIAFLCISIFIGYEICFRSTFFSHRLLPRRLPVRGRGLLWLRIHICCYRLPENTFRSSSFEAIHVAFVHPINQSLRGSIGEVIGK